MRIVIVGLLLLCGAALGGIIPLRRRQNVELVLPTATPDVTTNWRTYTNSEYGFQLKAPFILQSLTSNNGGDVLVNAVTYRTKQLVNGDNPSITIVEGAARPNVDLYDGTLIGHRDTINGVPWYIFHNPATGLAACDGASAQTIAKNRRDTIIISTFDESRCPGDQRHAPSLIFLEQLLSTFGFTK